MLKKISVMFCIIVFIITNVYGKSYEIGDIRINDIEGWHIFTEKDLIGDDLKKLNLDVNELKDFFKNNNVELYAFKYVSLIVPLEISIRTLDITDIEYSKYKYDIYNMKDFSEYEIKSAANNFATTRPNAIVGDILTTKTAKYFTIHFELDDFNVIEYVTVVNGKWIVISTNTPNTYKNNITDSIAFVEAITYNEIANKTDNLYITIGVLVIIAMIGVTILFTIKKENISKIKMTIGIVLWVLQILSLCGTNMNGELDDLFRIRGVASFFYLLGALSAGIIGSILIIKSYKKKKVIEEPVENINEQVKEELAEEGIKDTTEVNTVETIEKILNNNKKEIVAEENKADEKNMWELVAESVEKEKTKEIIEEPVQQEDVESVIEEKIEEESVEDEVEEILPPKYCNQCGIKLEENWEFCNSCGVKIRK